MRSLSALGLSSRQVQAAIDYIHAYEDAVSGDYEKIVARIRRGNPPHIQAMLEANRKKFQARVAQSRAVQPAAR